MAVAFTPLPRGAVAKAVFAFSEEEHVAVVCLHAVYVRRTLYDERLEPVLHGRVRAACPSRTRNTMLVVLDVPGNDGADTTLIEMHASGVIVHKSDCIPGANLLCTNDRHIAVVTADLNVAVFSFDQKALLRSWYLPGRDSPLQCKLDDSGHLHVCFEGTGVRTFSIVGAEAVSPVPTRFEFSPLQTRTSDAFYDLRSGELMELPWMGFM